MVTILNDGLSVELGVGCLIKVWRRRKEVTGEKYIWVCT